MLPGPGRDMVGTDLVNAESSLIHICCSCLFGDQDVVTGQMYFVFFHTGLLFSFDSSY